MPAPESSRSSTFYRGVHQLHHFRLLVKVRRLELPQHGPKPRVLPLHYTLIGTQRRTRTYNTLRVKQVFSPLN